MAISRKINITAVALVVATVPVLNGQLIKLEFGQKPKIPVTMQHPAALQISLAGKKVAFGPVRDGCPQQFADLVMQDFVRAGITVVNRSDLEAILKEHHFQASTSVDPSTAVEIGKVLGPGVMVFLNVTRCATQHDGPLYQDQVAGPRLNISRTEAHFLASIHTVDLATGRELGVNNVQADPKRENTAAFPNVPEYPGEFEVQDAALRSAAVQVNHLYFPWTERREVSFMNSKECNLRQAYDLLKTGDVAAVLKLSQENVAACKMDPKLPHQADALYNLGVAYMLNGQFDQALETLTESQRVHADKVTVATIQECRQAKDAAAATTAQQQIFTEEQKKDDSQRLQRETDAARSLLTNETIIKMTKAKTSDDILLKMIASQPAKFSMLPDDILVLKEAGVSDRVISAMLDKR